MDQRDKKVEREEGELPRTIFQTLLESNLPDEEKTVDRLWQEALLIIGAGTDTTGNTLAVITFHILNNPSILAKLKAELEVAMPNKVAPAKLSDVEQLPYLVSFAFREVFLCDLERGS
jgi:cytochrome P450